MYVKSDTPFNRRNTGSHKWNQVKSFTPPLDDDTISMSVADMDWPAPDCVTQAVAEYVQTAISGYTAIPDSYYDAVTTWFKDHFSWDVDPDWIVPTNGVVPDLNHGVSLLTEPGDQVIIFTPVYPPFHSAVTNNDRVLKKVSLLDDGNHFSIDWDAFEAAAREEKTKMLILCHPHNPVGRVWTQDELLHITKIAKAHNLLVLADEIHADLVAAGTTHIPFASLEDNWTRTCTMTAPSKTFNLASFKLSNLVIPCETLRTKWRNYRSQNSISEPPILSVVACEAAYRCGGPWLEELLTIIDQNEALVREKLLKAVPSLRIAKREGTYLLWIDCNKVEPDPLKLFDLIGREGHVLGNNGVTFGDEGSGWIRLNLATCPQTVEEAMNRIIRAITTYKVVL